MLKTQPPGTSDTSRIATDHINNPNTINPIFELGARLAVAGAEEVAGDSLNLPGVSAKMNVPHVLKDGADSVGVPGATLRVYVNIGSYSQHWLEQHNALIGLTPQKPFSVKTAQENSVYWLATQTKFTNIANFFMHLKSYRLADAPGGGDYITKDDVVMTRGKIVFAENCASCHSSKQPPANVDATEWFRAEVVKSNFLEDNFLSDDHRYPITKIKTNAERTAGTNAKRGHIWDAFSSETYKNLPSVGEIEVTNVFTGTNESWTVPGGGSGYYRTASLISCWSSAPFLHNNSLGEFTGDPSVAGRMKAFNDAAQKLLWPEKRDNIIWRTSQECNLQIQAAVMPAFLRDGLKLAGKVDSDGYFRIGPIPEGTPINLLANVDPEADPVNLVKLCLKLKEAFAKIKLVHLDIAATTEVLRTEVAPALWKVSKCPDFLEDRGHYFGSELPDADKLALIEFMKTF
jgi:cytochrome c1